MRWLLLVFIALFVFGQLTRLRPSQRDQQLQTLRAAAAQAGLLVRFWTARNSGYTYRHLPASGFLYSLPWPPKTAAPQHWGLWLSADGETVVLAGDPPSVAHDWLRSFRQRFPDAWVLLECADAGLGVLWQERGTDADVKSLAAALDLLRKSLL